MSDDDWTPVAMSTVQVFYDDFLSDPTYVLRRSYEGHPVEVVSREDGHVRMWMGGNAGHPMGPVQQFLYTRRPRRNPWLD